MSQEPEIKTATGLLELLGGGQSRVEVLLSEALRLLASQTSHRGCQDGWYACPKSPDYIPHDDPDDSGCDCGADEILAFFKKWGYVRKPDLKPWERDTHKLWSKPVDIDHCPKCGEYLHDEAGHSCP